MKMRRALSLLLAAPLAARAQDQPRALPENGRRLNLASLAAGLGPDPALSLPNTSSDVMSGLVEAFLHKERMPEDERLCLVNGTGELTENVMRVASHTVMLMQAALGVRSEPPPLLNPPPRQSAEDLEKAAKAEDLRKSGALVERRLQEGGALGMALGASQLFIDLGVSLQKIALLSHTISKDCIRGEAREALQRASEHMRNAQYISGHFLANGADIVSEIGDGLDKWNGGRYRDFGRSMGTALRKAVLSNTTSGRLPEGKPTKDVLGNVTVGLIDGLLGKGFTLEVEMLDRPKADLHIDLRHCVGQNLFFFQSAWSATMYFFAQQAAQVKEDKTKFKEVKKRFGSQIAFTMMQLPHALKTCNINEYQEHAIMDAVRAFGTGVSFHFGVPPGHHFGLPQVEAVMKQAVEDWKQCKWYSFGHDIGKLLQLVVLTMFPKKYSVDSDGSLRQQLAEQVGHDDPHHDDPIDNSGVYIAIPVVALLMVSLIIASFRRTLLLVRRDGIQLARRGGSAEQPATPALPRRDIEEAASSSARAGVE